MAAIIPPTNRYHHTLGWISLVSLSTFIVSLSSDTTALLSVLTSVISDPDETIFSPDSSRSFPMVISDVLTGYRFPALSGPDHSTNKIWAFSLSLDNMRSMIERLSFLKILSDRLTLAVVCLSVSVDFLEVPQAQKRHNNMTYHILIASSTRLSRPTFQPPYRSRSDSYQRQYGSSAHDR